jgi:hypothetical protein
MPDDVLDTNETTDDGLPWGHIEDGVWRQLPKRPMLLAGLGPPPFVVLLPIGVERYVVHKPASQSMVVQQAAAQTA